MNIYFKYRKYMIQKYKLPLMKAIVTMKLCIVTDNVEIAFPYNSGKFEVLANSQKATALAAATFKESTPGVIGIFTV